MAEELISPIRQGAHDIAVERERMRRRRVYRLAAVILLAEAWVITAALLDRPVLPRLPAMDPFLVTIVIFFAAMLLIVVLTTVGTSRSPHLVYRPEQVDVRLDDVIGIDPVKEDVRRSIDLFQTHRRFADQMGGTPRRGLLFEGLPGTGKTLTAKAMAAEAGVPFLFVSATSFQSMYYGATARKIRAYFRALRTTARREGGAIGFIEEIDAIALRRGGMLGAAPSGVPSAASACVSSSSGPLPGLRGTTTNAVISEGTGGVVNELLVQMQSFDEPTGLDKLVNRMIAAVNLLLPGHKQLKQRRPGRAPILLIAATNRADSLDPALLRPGRFDRHLTFSAPDAHGRRALVDHFLARRSHEVSLDDPVLRDRIAAATNGWTPVMVEHLLDEALVNALRRGSTTMSFHDVEQARITEMVGIGQPVRYTEAEQRLIATHEAGHATVAWLVAPNRTLEGADDHPPRRRARPARAQRLRGGVDALAVRPAGARADRDGRVGRRGAVLRAHVDRPRERPGRRDAYRRADGRRRGDDRFARVVPRGRPRPGLRGARRPRLARAARGRARRGPLEACGVCCRATGTSSRRCATRCWSGTS
ncbi:ATP-dependent zinc metalloprotease FtsH [Cellulomonas persica]